MTPVATFTSQFQSALTTFHATHPGALVFVSSIPNVYQLWNLLKGNRSATSAWRTFGICQSMLAAGNSESTRQAVLAQEKQFNSALASVCGQASAYCRFDGNTTFGYAFTAREVSTVDYFHPSVTGQATLARITWTASYWG
jgi:hypothetical protein